MSADILQEQLQYYRDRAPEYDEWFWRRGRYDRGEKHRQQWFAEVAEVEAVLRSVAPCGEILELACGTGLWTRHLISFADRLVAIDGAPEAIALNRQRLGNASVEYMIADLFDWHPNERFDFIFFGFWLSHVPTEKFASFWQTVEKALKPNGKVFFVDSLLSQESTARNHSNLDNKGYSERKLNDGRTYRVVKIFYRTLELERSLIALGWRGKVDRTENYFLHGLFARK